MNLHTKLTPSKSPIFDNLLIKLISITKENTFDTLIKITAPKFLLTTDKITDNKYWKSGVGYGNDSRKAWDIK